MTKSTLYMPLIGIWPEILDSVCGSFPHSRLRVQHHLPSLLTNSLLLLKRRRKKKSICLKKRETKGRKKSSLYQETRLLGMKQYLKNQSSNSLWSATYIILRWGDRRCISLAFKSTEKIDGKDGKKNTSKEHDEEHQCSEAMLIYHLQERERERKRNISK